MATQGPLYPGTVATEVGPSGDNDWLTPSNVGADDGSEAQITAATYDSGDHSYRLMATNFGFDVAGTINGITVEIDRRCFAGTARDQEVRLYNASSTLVGDDKATATAWPVSTAVATYGASNDTWAAGLTAADINSANFGVALIVAATAANVDIGVDFIRVTVTYTPDPNVTVTPGVATLTTATFAPTVSLSDNQTVTPDVAALATATFAPTVSTSGGGGAGIAFRAVSENTGASVTATGNKPTDTADGDVLIASVAFTSSSFSVSSVPSGWTAIAADPGPGDFSHVVYIKVASGEPASWDWGLSGSDTWAVHVLAYSGGATTGQPDGSSVTIAAAVNSLATASVTPTVTGDMFVGVWAADVATGTRLWSYDGAMTERVEANTNALRVGIADELLSSTSALQRTGTVDGSVQDLTAWAILIKPGAAGSVTVTPGVASLTTATFAPTVTASDHKLVTPTTASLTTTTFAPTLTVTAHQTLTPATAGLTTSAFAPTVTATDHKLLTPGVASLSTSAFAPTVTASDHQSVTPSTASLATSTFAPTVTATQGVVVTPGAAELALAAFEPTVSVTAHQTVTPGVVALTTAAFAPTVTASDHQSVVPSPASLSLATFIPVVTAVDPKLVTPDTASLTTTGFAPTINAGTTVVTEAGSLTLETFAPTVALTDNLLITPEQATLALTSFSPVVTAIASQLVTPGTASLVLTSYAPTVGQGVPDDPGFASVTSALAGGATATASTSSSATVALIGGASSNVELISE